MFRTLTEMHWIEASILRITVILSSILRIRAKCFVDWFILTNQWQSSANGIKTLRSLTSPKFSARRFPLEHVCWKVFPSNFLGNVTKNLKPLTDPGYTKDAPSPSVLFSCSFGENFGKIIGWRPHRFGVGTPSSEKSWIPPLKTFKSLFLSSLHESQLCWLMSTEEKPLFS